MPPLKKNESPNDVVQAIDRLETRSDKCYRTLSLLARGRCVATWTILTEAIRLVEMSVPTAMYGSRNQLNTLTNASMMAALLYKFTRQYCRTEPFQVNHLSWTPRIEAEAKHAFEVVRGYLTFCTVFPYWHANMYAGEITEENTVRFVSQASPLGRRINAYRQGLRPSGHPQEKQTGMQTTPSMQRHFARSLGAAKRTSQRGVMFGHLEDIYEALYESHAERTSAMMRRYPDIKIGDYNLDEFRRFYAAINAIAGTHEFLCYLWSQDNSLPADSLLLYWHRAQWVKELSRLAGLPVDQVYAMIKDATFGRVYAVDFHLLPFVPMTTDASILALAPFCSLSSNWEENVLRCLSRRDSDLYSTHTLSKEDEMRLPLISLTSGTRLITGPHKLPKPHPDIDLIVQDLAAKILIVCELKWNRKPNGLKERLQCDAEVFKGFSQIRKVKDFIESNPRHLVDRKYLAWDISKFEQIHYCVIARDHIVEPPADGEPIYGYEDFRAGMMQNTNTSELLKSLDNLEWLPVEGRDYWVRFERSYANGVALESEVYYPAGTPLAMIR